MPKQKPIILRSAPFSSWTIIRKCLPSLPTGWVETTFRLVDKKVGFWLLCPKGSNWLNRSCSSIFTSVSGILRSIFRVGFSFSGWIVFSTTEVILATNFSKFSCFNVRPQAWEWPPKRINKSWHFPRVSVISSIGILRPEPTICPSGRWLKIIDGRKYSSVSFPETRPRMPTGQLSPLAINIFFDSMSESWALAWVKIWSVRFCRFWFLSFRSLAILKAWSKLCVIKSS